MPLKMWMYDLAREQCPTRDHLYEIAHLSLDAGFDALGIYLEHRFAYPSAPWVQGKGCLSAEAVRSLRAEFPSLKIVPFINLLGHFEGFLYTEQGRAYREEVFKGMQGCPANSAFVSFCESLIDDTLEAFDSDLIHIGGDETWQLGANPACQARMAELQEKEPGQEDGKALLYGEHFGPLAERVKRAGRRPAVWGDMFVDHPSALHCLPKDTLIFDWQYFNGVAESSQRFTEAGFEVVGSPAIQTYNATWMHVEQSETNVRTVANDVSSEGLHGTCVTTWELGLMGAYDTLFPALRACGEILNGQQGSFYEAYANQSPQHEEWARLMSEELAALGGTFTPGRIRSSLKVRLLLNANPFLAWVHHAEEFAESDIAEKAIEIANRAIQVAPSEAYKGPAVFLRSAVEFVQIAEAARQEYAYGHTEAAVAKLATTRQLFDDLGKYARWTHQRIGGSLADVERCRIAKEWVEKVMTRIRAYGDGRLGYLPAWEVITHPKFVPHDQASWWLINRWSNE